MTYIAINNGCLQYNNIYYPIAHICAVEMVNVKEINRKIPPPPLDPIINRAGFSLGFFMLAGLLIATGNYNAAICSVIVGSIIAWLAVIAFRQRQEKVDKVFTNNMFGLATMLTNGQHPVFVSPDRELIQQLQHDVLAMIAGDADRVDCQHTDVNVQCFPIDELKL